MTTTDYAARPRVEVGGAELAPEIDAMVEGVVVEDHLHAPDIFSVVFSDPERSVLSRTGLEVGTKVRVLAGAVGSEATDLLLSGEVTAYELQRGAGGSRLVVRGYDESHRLHRGRRTETFRNATDAELARSIARRVGLRPGTIDDTGVTHDHVSRMNLTDWEFLQARAGEVGFEVAVLDGTLNFRRPAASADGPDVGDLATVDPLQLALGANLDEFAPRLTSAQQVGEVEVRGWDPKRKESIVGRAPAETSSVTLGVTPTDVARIFSEDPFVLVGRGLGTQAEVDAAARAVAEEIATAFVEATGVARGDPRLKAGTPVSVGLVGEPFDGRYTLTSTRHVFDVDGYRTHFVVSGRQERSLLGLMSLGATGGARASGAPPIFGVVTGVVSNARDPEDLGRVKLSLPWLSPDYESDWARVAMAGAGPDRGFFVVPEVGDEVLVAFEHGDVRRPFVVGGLFNGVDHPPAPSGGVVDGSSGRINSRRWVSRRGHAIEISDEMGAEKVEITTVMGSRITLDEATMKIEIHSPGNLDLRAIGTLALEATNVEIKGSARVSVSGGIVQLN